MGEAPFSVADALAYVPVTGSVIDPDGRWVAAVVSRYDAVRDATFEGLYVLDLEDRGAWRAVGRAGDVLHGPTFGPDGRLAVFRSHGVVEDLVVFDLAEADDVEGRPVAGMPPNATALKWWDTPGRLACLGVDPQETRRLLVWDDAATPPRAVTPPRRRVVDFAFAPESPRLVWLHGPPRRLGRPEPVSTLWYATHPRLRGYAVRTPESYLGFLSWDPTGQVVAGLSRPEGEVLAAPHLQVVHPETMETWFPLRGVDGWITGYDWLPGEHPTLLVAMEQGVVGRLLRVTLEGVVQPVGPEGTYLSGPKVARRTGRILHLRQDGDEPQHLRVRDGGRDRRVTRFNARLADHDLRPEETQRWTSPDGTVIEGLLMVPTGEGPHPLVVWCHGGPAEHLQRTFSPWFQVLAGAGWAVLAPNFRGSTGRDDAFLRASVGDLGGADVDDLLAGVDALATDDRIDPTRVAAIGWSYGATLALLAAARRPIGAGSIRAVVAGCPVVDWLTAFGAPAWPYVTRAYFPGDPWDVPEAYDALSPIRHLRTLAAPTLLLHGSDDPRVPVGQSRLVQRLLLAKGRQADLRIFPGEGHVFASAWARREAMVRTLAWFSTHVSGA